MISVVATEAVMNPDPHRASAVTLRCWSHESNRRHPASAGVKTAMADNVERLGTLITPPRVSQTQTTHVFCHYSMVPFVKLHLAFKLNAALDRGDLQSVPR